MKPTLTITYGGDSEAIRRGSLSVAEFGPALNQLLTAVRRTASAVASGKEGRVSSRGSIADAAKLMDIHITGISHGSLIVQTDIVDSSPVTDAYLFPKGDIERLPEITMIRLLEDMQAESEGKVRNDSVRKYLGLLPESVHHQRYTLTRGKELLVDFSVGQVELADCPPSLPNLDRIAGRVTALCVEEGKETVSIRSHRKRWTLFASADLVQRAYELKSQEILATIVAGGDSENLPRLIRLDEFEPPAPSSEERINYIVETWSGALSELAK